MTFNWTSLPALLAMLLFWMLACYVLTRVGRGPTAWTLVAFQVGAATYFLSQAMRANAPTLGDWLFWARGLYWTSPITAVLWYRLSVLLLRDLHLSEAHPALLRAVSALGLLVTISAAALVVAIYGSDLVFVWSAAGVPPPERAPYYRFDVPNGPLYPLGAAHYLVCLLGAIGNAALGRLLARDSLERHHFGRLLLAGGLFFLGINSLVLYRLLFEGWAIWPSNVVVTLGVVVIALDTTAYCLHLEKKVMGRDLLSFLVGLVALCGLYALLVASVTRGYSFQTLELLVSLLLAIILSHAVVDPARRAWDPLFFNSDVRRLLSLLRDTAQSAALTRDLGTLLSRTQAELADVSIERLIRRTDAAMQRSVLHDRLQQAMSARQHGNRSVAVVVTDLARSGDPGTGPGELAGALLLQVEARLGQALPRAATVTRIGGAELAVILPEVDDAAAALQVADVLLAALAAPVVLDGQTVDVRASLGIALYPQHGKDAAALLLRAETALRVAEHLESRRAVYDAEQEAFTVEQLVLANDLRVGIEQGQLLLHYQPKVQLRSGRVYSVEALVRWQHPQRGLVPPNDFIPLAEHTGLVTPLTEWVLDEALRQCRAWREAGLDIPVAVNLSARTLPEAGLSERITQALAQAGVPPRSLTVEVTESSLMGDLDQARQVLARLRDLGVRIAIDDFGTGYSSLAYLKELPVDMLKIDRAFVQDLERDANDAAIVRSTIELGHHLGLQIVAEGVETRATWDLLAGLGCDLAQGYYASKPLAAADLTRWHAEWLASWARLPVAA